MNSRDYKALRYDILKKSELAVYMFSRKVATEADKSGYKNIHKQLIEQAVIEYQHAQIFAELEGSRLTETPQALIRRGKQSLEWGSVNWDTERKYYVSNLSQNPLAKIFFKNKSADSYSFLDKLAFMIILEEYQSNFYYTLSTLVDSKIKDKVLKILRDEHIHACTLKKLLLETIPENEANKYLNRWRRRALFVFLYAPIYFLKTARNRT